MASLPSVNDETFEPLQAYRSNNLFDWVEERPRPKMRRPAQREQIAEMLFAAMALPYRGVWNSATQRFEIEDEMFEGATYGEVMQFKLVEGAAQKGDIKAITEILDRTLGRPKQAIEQVSMRMSYAEFLEHSAEEAKKTGEFYEDYRQTDYAQHRSAEELDDLLFGV